MGQDDFNKMILSYLRENRATWFTRTIFFGPRNSDGSRPTEVIDSTKIKPAPGGGNKIYIVEHCPNVTAAAICKNLNEHFGFDDKDQRHTERFFYSYFEMKPWYNRNDHILVIQIPEVKYATNIK